jgi:hypothetical protein
MLDRVEFSEARAGRAERNWIAFLTAYAGKAMRAALVLVAIVSSAADIPAMAQIGGTGSIT